MWLSATQVVVGFVRADWTMSALDWPVLEECQPRGSCSRGGLMLYNWAVEHPKSIGGIAGIYPVCNLVSYPGLKRAAGAYEMTTDELKAKLTRHNPIDRLAPLAKAKVPILHLHGDKDRTVPLEANSAELAKRYKAFGDPVEVVLMNSPVGGFRFSVHADREAARVGELDHTQKLVKLRGPGRHLGPNSFATFQRSRMKGGSCEERQVF